MRADRTEVADRKRGALSLGLSLGVHALLLVSLLWLGEPPPPPVRHLEVTLIGPSEVSDGAPTPQGEPPAALAVTSPPAPKRVRAQPTPSVPEAPTGTLPAPQPPGPPTPAPPRSFRDWQRARATRHLPEGNPFGTGSAGAGGTGAGPMASRNRCEPAPGRRFDRLYLLFDSSGSMDTAARAEALTCAHQYAKAAIGEGASVVVGSFARDTQFAGPTRSMMDVEFALRATVDATATVLPWAQLEPYLAAGEDQASELVIVSDGMFGTGPELLSWYRSFLARNRGNRATFYTVGGAGQRQAVERLQATGMEVFDYDQIRRP